MANQWKGFNSGKWQDEIDVRDFIQTNFTPYEGDDSFLEGISKNTEILWDRSKELLAEELKVRVLDIEMDSVSGVNNFKPGYIVKDHDSSVVCFIFT